MKRTGLFTVALLGGLALTLALVVLANQVALVRANPGVLYVAPGGNCNGAIPCYGSVQAAVDAAASGDEIRVAASTYTGVTTCEGVTQTVYIDKAITIRGGYTTNAWDASDPEANPTILDAQQQGRVLYITGDISPTIEGLHITGGNAGGLGGDAWLGRDAGGGIYILNSAATVRDNHVYSNTSGSWGFGGGVYLNWSASILDGNSIFSNAAGTGGGVAIWFDDPVLSRNIITGNANSGVWLYGHTPTFSENVISGNDSDLNGGGVELYYGGALFNGNTITGNSAKGNGGGVFLYTYSGAKFDGDIISSNVAPQGSGLYVSWHSNAYLTNTVIADNQATAASGGGLYVEKWSSMRLVHDTIARNVGISGIRITGEGVDDGSTVTIINTMLISHSVGIGVTGGNTVTVNGVLWHNTPITVSQTTTATVSVQNQYVGDPAFAADGYHVIASSMAIDKGVAAGTYDDIDGQARPFDAGPDLGADEWATVETTAEPSTPAVITATVGGVTTTVMVPAGAVTETTTLKYTALATTTRSSPSGLSFAHRAFDLDAYNGETLLPDFAFSRSVTITLHYTDADVAGLDEDTLMLEYWNESMGTWEDAACDSYGRHPDENWLVVPICHLSRFALFGEEYTVYLPLVLRNY